MDVFSIVPSFNKQRLLSALINTAYRLSTVNFIFFTPFSSLFQRPSGLCTIVVVFNIFCPRDNILFSRTAYNTYLPLLVIAPSDTSGQLLKTLVSSIGLL